MRTEAWLSTIALGCMFFSATGSKVALSAEKLQSEECRLIVNWDTANMWNEVLYLAQQGGKPDATEVMASLEQIVDEHAKAKVDTIVHCGFVLPWGTVPPDFKSFKRLSEPGYRALFHPGGETGLREFEEAGGDLFQVLLDRSHKNGLRFVGGMRMNDRHGGSTSEPFCVQHPEWMVDGYADYKHEGVRNAVLAVAAEFLERYDLDGIELDWMRWCDMFKRSEAVQNAPLLTDFTAQMRKVLDQAAKERGRDKLLLGVRVPPSIEECRLLGFDVKAWVQKALVDFICPMDFGMTDVNTRTEDFTALTKGTQCKVYPTIHPQYVDQSLRKTPTGEQPVIYSAENYRAAAKNFYGFGAGGVSAYNYQDHWVADPDEWPRAMSYLTGLRNSTVVAHGDRHYMVYPTSTTPGVVAKYEKIVLNRKAGDPAGSLRFRMAEDLGKAHLSATLKFKVTGMAEGDEFEVALNGKAIPADQFERRYDTKRQTAFYVYRTPLASPPEKFGDNDVRVRLTKSAGTATLVVQEFEVLVRDSRAR